ncbi:hypothetical protein OGAPHI_005487 [Ogataea philodendri]|uniref:Nucleolar protein 12 n=1 Tax=Ogataea philodendri TaxID=1378263 RepID=A0A9P8T1K8_9ASCO|nr:uncharacterized protein OGAPHI_005487 [Ogataea philodendri]KAH3662239.1 hypothetical protein OGAPHI_005487 [Ogataea philodendri]
MSDSLATLFAQPSRIDNKELVARKRTLVDVPKSEEEQAALDSEKGPSKRAKRAADFAKARKESSSGTKSEPKYDPEQEKEKNKRTVFIGNLPTSVLSSKKATKSLKAAFSKFGSIESLRFRSFAVQSNIPRKAAYILKDVKEDDSTNCYMVFKNEEDSLKAVELNGTIFLDHYIRVDHVTQPLKQENKLSVFVGNLDFEETEQSLWKFFNEKCSPDGTNVVANVRLVRDSKTNYGKGFAIVQFTDTNYVSKALLLNKQLLTTSKKPRELRITRCKTQMAGPVKDKKYGAAVRSGKVVLEGERAKKGSRVKGLKSAGGKKKPRNPDGRAARRSKEFSKKHGN